MKNETSSTVHLAPCESRPVVTGLTKKQILFAHRVAEDPEASATKCAVSAGYSEISASQAASVNMANPKIQEAIQARRDDLAAAAGVTPELMLRNLMLIATADPRELVQVKMGACRHCHGIDHLYQWTPAEYARKFDEAMEKNKPAPELLGGLGYNGNAQPSPECPECFGDGVQRVIHADTRTLSPGAAALYAGAQASKDGIKGLQRNQDNARASLLDYLGMSNKGKTELTGPGGGPIGIQAEMLVHEMTDAQLIAIAAQAHTRVIEGRE